MCLSEHQKKAKSMEVDSKLVSQYISERKGSTRNVNFHLEALESADLKCLQKTEKLSEEFPDSCCLDPFIEFKRNLTSTEEYSKNDVCDCFMYTIIKFGDEGHFSEMVKSMGERE